MADEPRLAGDRTRDARGRRRRPPRPDDDADAPVALELSGVTRRYATETAVKGLDLRVTEGELLTLLGPSGCGKTTTLRMLAGLERPDAGSVAVAGETVADGSTFVPPEDRDVGIVFQDFALFPHLSVSENVAFGLTDLDDAERERRVDDLLDLVNLAAQRDASPDELSGGQKQRVALARSLAPEPDVLLLDEPFSNLDVRLRERMREEVRAILKEAGVTAVSVTHDQEEALSISDRVAVMHDGRVQQVGRPEAVFEHPESRFVASFLGQAGFVSGRLEAGRVETGLGTLDESMIDGLTDAYDGAAIDVLVRPDDLRAVPAETGPDGGAEPQSPTGAVRADGADRSPDDRSPADRSTELPGDGRIVHRQYTGPAFVYRVELDSGDVVHCQHNHATEFELDQRVRVDLVADHTLAWYPAE